MTSILPGFTTINNQEDKASEQTIQEKYRPMDPSNIAGAPILGIKSFEAVFSASLKLFAQVPRTKDDMLMTNPFALLWSGMNSNCALKEILQSSKCDTIAKQKAFLLMIATYTRGVRLFEYKVFGKDKDGSKSSQIAKEWKGWWNFTDPFILWDYYKYMGIWSSEGGFAGGTTFEKDGTEIETYEERAKKAMKLDREYKNCHMKGSVWMINPVMCKLHEKGFTPGEIGTKCFLGAKLTVYFIKHEDWDDATDDYVGTPGYVYVEFIFEDFYGARFENTRDPKFKYFRPIGTVVEFTKQSKCDYVEEMKNHITGDAEKDLKDVYSEYERDAGYIRIKVYTE